MSYNKIPYDLRSGGTGLTAYSAGDLLYYSSSSPNALCKIPIGTAGQALIGDCSSAPSWSSNYVRSGSQITVDCSSCGCYLYASSSDNLVWCYPTISTCVNNAICDGACVCVLSCFCGTCTDGVCYVDFGSCSYYTAWVVCSTYSETLSNFVNGGSASITVLGC